MKVVVNIITGLNTGGAERALYNVIQGGLTEHYKIVVVSLTDEGRYGPLLQELDVPVHCLGMTQGVPSLTALWHLRKLIKMYQPSVIQGWMYHGNILASIARWFSSKPVCVMWNVRHCLDDIKSEQTLTQWIIRVCKCFSRSAATIVYNGQLSRVQHEEFGWSDCNGLVIPNGFELDRFFYDERIRSRVRQIFHLDDSVIVIGLIARYHPIKDHEGFLRAAVSVAKKRSDVVFLLAGTGVTDQNEKLLEIIPSDMQSQFMLLGERSDVEELYSAMDAFCLSSLSEAFPNVLGEAMASSLPCITTDVGDAAFIVGETGQVVQPGDPAALAGSMLGLLEKTGEERARLGQAARDRIEENFSLDRVVEMYVALYGEAPS
jgi:glycosyltransferase involved in cell wall biosynthesis